MSLKKNYLFISKSSIQHGFFTRLNGFSKKPYRSLNCSSSNGDSKKNVFKNKLIAMKNLNFKKN